MFKELIINLSTGLLIEKNYHIQEIHVAYTVNKYMWKKKNPACLCVAHVQRLTPTERTAIPVDVLP